MEGEGADSFCLRDVGFKMLVRNANVDIKKAVENSHLVSRGEVWAADTNSEPSTSREHLNPRDWLRVAWESGT